MVSDSSLKVFVYGTLKPGEENYRSYCEGFVTAAVEAIALGTLYDLPLGYPALAAGTEVVHGYLLTFADAQLLQVLDELEAYEPGRSPEHNEYQRDWIEIWHPQGESLGFAWVYRMSHEQAKAWGGTVLKLGYWSSQLTSTVPHLTPESGQ